MYLKPLKQTSIVLSALLIAASSLNATAIAYTVEVDSIIVDSNPIDKTERDAGTFEALGFFVNDATFASFVGDSVWGTGNELTITTDGYANIISFLNSNGLGSAEPLNAVPQAIPSSNLYSESVDSGSAGNHPILIVHDGGAGNVGSLSAGNHIGIVAATSITDGLSSKAIGFGTAERWDTTLLGNLTANVSPDPASTMDLAEITAVPEPSTLALLAACIGLCVVARRRG